MKATLIELIEGIGYSTIEVTIETPIAKSNFVMEIDHVSKAEHGYYVEAEDGCFLELSEDVDIIWIVINDFLYRIYSITLWICYCKISMIYKCI